MGTLYEVLVTSNNKQRWAEWIRLSTARAVTDIREFVEFSTNDVIPGFDEAFLTGFVETAEQVVSKKSEILSNLRLSDAELDGPASPRELERESIVEMQEYGTELIGILINVLEEELEKVHKAKSRWAALRLLALGERKKKLSAAASKEEK